MPAPGLLAGVQVGRGEPAADAVLRARDAGDRQILDHERRHGDDLRDRRIGDLAFPGDLAGLLVGRDQPTVQGVRDHLVPPQRDAAVVDAAAGHRAGPVLVGARIHLPHQLARALGQVELVHRAPAVGDVHGAVLDDRRALEAAMRPDAAALDAAQREGPGDLEILDVVLVDLVERRVAGRRIVAVMAEPVLGLRRGVEQSIRGRFARCQRRDRQCGREQAG
jgi:hypothetical protein